MKIREIICENYVDEEVSDLELTNILGSISQSWAKHGIKLTIGSHFKERLNDIRNVTQYSQQGITANDLETMLTLEADTHHTTIKYKIGLKKKEEDDSGINNDRVQIEGVFKDTSKHINVPFVATYYRNTGHIGVHLKSIQIKQNFITTNDVYRVKSVKNSKLA